MPWNPADDYADEHPIILPPAKAKRYYKRIDGKIVLSSEWEMCIYCLGTGKERSSNGYGQGYREAKCLCCDGKGWRKK